jgi:hypothetical protein
MCKGERSTMESPAQLVRGHQNQLMMWCMCHDGPLTAASDEDFGRHIAAGRFDPSVKATGAILWEDDVCDYNHITVKEFVAE